MNFLGETETAQLEALVEESTQNTSNITSDNGNTNISGSVTTDEVVTGNITSDTSDVLIQSINDFVKLSAPTVGKGIEVQGNVLPNTNSTHDIGTNLLKFKDTYINGKVYAPAIENYAGQIDLNSNKVDVKSNLVSGNELAIDLQTQSIFLQGNAGPIGGFFNTGTDFYYGSFQDNTILSSLSSGASVTVKNNGNIQMSCPTTNNTVTLGGITICEGNLTPSIDNVFSLGSPLLGFSDAYITGNVNCNIVDAFVYRLSGVDGTIFKTIGTNYIASNGTATGADNVIIGNNACLAGVQNSSVYIGANSGQNQTFSDNVAIGRDALKGTAGAACLDNVAIGAFCAQNITGSSSRNVSIGRNCARNYNGNNNVSIGHAANVGGTSQNCVAIGQDAKTTNKTNSIALGYQGNSDADNQCIIGNGSLSQIVPGGNQICDLGRVDRKFKDVHVSGTVYAPVVENYTSPMSLNSNVVLLNSNSVNEEKVVVESNLPDIRLEDINGTIGGLSKSNNKLRLGAGVGYPLLIENDTQSRFEILANGNLEIQSNGPQGIAITGDIVNAGNIEPSTDASYDLGSTGNGPAEKRYQNLYLSGNVDYNGVLVNNGAEVNFPVSVLIDSGTASGTTLDPSATNDGFYATENIKIGYNAHEIRLFKANGGSIKWAKEDPLGSGVPGSAGGTVTTNNTTVTIDTVAQGSLNGASGSHRYYTFWPASGNINQVNWILRTKVIRDPSTGSLYWKIEKETINFRY